MANDTETDLKGKAKGFFQALFDFSFKDFITSKLISFLFGAGVIVGGIIVAGVILGAFATAINYHSMGPLFITLIAAPIAYLAAIIVLRILLELTMVIFKIEENTR